MQRYFLTEDQFRNDDTIFITENDAHHIINVMRMEIGNRFIAQHPDQGSALAEITNFQDKIVDAKVIKWLEEDNELPIDVTIAQGLPKGSKIEWIVQKGTELGAKHFCLLEMDRSVAKWNVKSGPKKLARYEKIMKEASEQCHRNVIPTIEGAYSIKEMLEKRRPYDVILFAYEEEAKKETYHSFSKVIQSLEVKDRILLFIGPEGGFSEKEVELLEEYDAKPVRLGKRILRTETAALYALSSISYHFEELNEE